MFSIISSLSSEIFALDTSILTVALVRYVSGVEISVTVDGVLIPLKTASSVSSPLIINRNSLISIVSGVGVVGYVFASGVALVTAA